MDDETRRVHLFVSLSFWHDLVGRGTLRVGHVRRTRMVQVIICEGDTGQFPWWPGSFWLATKGHLGRPHDWMAPSLDARSSLSSCAGSMVSLLSRAGAGVGCCAA